MPDTCRICLRAGQHAQVRPIGDGMQERAGRRRAHAAPLRHLIIRDAFVVAAVEVSRLRNAALVCGLDEGVENLPPHARFLDA